MLYVSIIIFSALLYTYYHSSRKIRKALNLGFGQSPMHRRCLMHQISDTPFRLRMDSLPPMTMV